MGFLPTIGIECHIQLKTKTKLFAAVANQDIKAKPNSLVSPLCLGLPGSLPVLNKKAVELGIRAGLILNGKIAKQISFDRKHYFYPDLPLGYQISQHYQPLVTDGHISIYSPTIGQDKLIRIQEAHLEADAGKSTHSKGSNWSLVDFNRAGAPLLEIVSYPDIHSAAEAKEYAYQLYLNLIYAGVGEADLSKGQMRFDVNVSLSKDDKLGQRSELKNLNSFRFIDKAVEFEIRRQSQRLLAGQEVIQETRGYNEETKTTFSQRSKEEANDYRYMPDPDLPPVTISQREIDQIRASLPVLPGEIRELLTQIDIDQDSQEVVIDQPPVASWLADLIRVGTTRQAVIGKLINWLVGNIRNLIRTQADLNWDSVLEKADEILELANALEDQKISSTVAKNSLLDIILGKVKTGELVEQASSQQEGSAELIDGLIDQVFAANQEILTKIEDNPKIIGFLIGQVIKLSDQQLDPVQIKALISKRLNGLSD